MITSEVMLMIAEFLFGDYDAMEFSYDLPSKLVEIGAAFRKENLALAELLVEELPETCSWFDHDTSDEGTIDETQFRKKVAEVYQRAVPLAAARKVS